MSSGCHNTALSVCYMVATLDEKKKFEMGVSTDWYIAIEYWKSSSIRVIFVDYQTSKLQCKYQSYIQVRTIGDTWNLSDIAPIAPSGGFSSEILTGVGL